MWNRGQSLTQQMVPCLLSLLLMCVSSAACAQGFVFWTDRATDVIKRANLDGSGATAIANLNNENYTLHVDSTARKLYWVGSVSGTIQRSEFDGSLVETIISGGLQMPRELVVDSAHNQMYWAEQGTFKIRRADLNGANIVDVATNAYEPYGIAGDFVHGKLYWTTGTILGPTGDGVWSANLDGSNSQLIRASGSDAIHGVEVDVDAGKVLWGVDFPGPVGQLQQSALDGTQFSPLLTGVGVTDYRHLALDPVHQTIYFDDLGTKKVYRCDYSGAALQVVVPTGDPHSVAVYIPEPFSLTSVGLLSLISVSRYRARHAHNTRATRPIRIR